MSYGIWLKDATGATITFPEPHHITGGTYAIGGTQEAWLNITWNYAPFYYEHIDPDKGIRFLYGKTAQEVVHLLAPIIGKLGTERSDDYWDATPGNAGAALADLAALCLKAPHGIIDGD